MTIRLYLRLSRTTDESTSIERQEVDGRAYAGRRWFGVPIVVYTDDGVSGAVPFAERTGGAKLVSEWQRGDVLLAVALDRVTRSLFGFADIVRDSERAGVALVTVNGQFDLGTPAGKLQASILAVVAEWERENVRARVLNARRHLHKVGRWPGGRVPYGLKAAPHPDGIGKTLVRDDVAARVIKHIVAEVADGIAPTTLARTLQTEGIPCPRVHTSTRREPKTAAWSERSIRLILDAPHVVGHQIDPIMGRLLRDDEGMPLAVWPPIVSEEDLAAARAMLKPATPRAAPAGRHWLYGVATCGECNGNMKRSNGGKNQPDTVVFRCKGPLSASHPSVSVRADMLSEFVRARVRAMLGPARIGERVYHAGATAGADIERLREFLTELEDDRKAGMYRTAEALERFRRQYADTAQRIEELEAAPQQAEGWTYALSESPFSATWDSLTDDQRGAWLREAGAKVTVNRPAVKRTRVPLSERASIDLGELNEIADEVFGMEV